MPAEFVDRNEVDTDWFNDLVPGSGSKRQRYITRKETEDYLVQHIKAYILDRVEDPYKVYLSGYPMLTIHECWDGYSEYTVTSTWSEIEINWDGHHHFFGNTTAFFTAMAVTDPDKWNGH